MYVHVATGAVTSTAQSPVVVAATRSSPRCSEWVVANPQLAVGDAAGGPLTSTKNYRSGFKNVKAK